MKKVLKWTVPVDDQPHEIGAGSIVHIASQFGRDDELQVWTEESMGDDNLAPNRVVKVVGTGHDYNDSGTAVGSVVTRGGHLVWHLIEYKPLSLGPQDRPW